MNNAAISTPHRDATDAGWAVLEAGGSAVDAAIAAAAVLSVVYPHNCSIGGDLVALVKEPDSAPECVLAVGRSPLNSNVEQMRSRFGEFMPQRGGATLTVPGAPAGWQHLHERFGRLAPSKLLRRAVDLAQGYHITRSVTLAAAKAAAAGGLGQDVVTALFGSSYEEGKTVSNPALARTLVRMSNAGFREFYEGETGSALLGHFQTLRPEFTTGDFTGAGVCDLEPLCGNIGDLLVYTSPPPTQGFALIRLLENLPQGPVDIDAPEIVELMQSNAQFCNYLRDNVLTDQSGRDFYRSEKSPEGRVPAMAESGAPADGDTIGISCVDGTGLSVSWIQSLYSHFGSYVLDPFTGVVLQNRGTSFSFAEGKQNQFRPAAMPPHTLMPVMATDTSHRLRYIQSTMGGKAQPQIHSQVLLRQLGGQSPRDAVNAPRWIVEGNGARAATPVVEESVAAPTRALLEKACDAVRVEADCSDGLGHMQLVTLDGTGSLMAASDPRSDGSARVGRLR